MSYTPNPIDAMNQTIPRALKPLIERLAESAHDHWALRRLGEGWTLAEQRNDDLKTHPCLVPYDELPESEREYDRDAVTETIKAILALGYKIEA